MISLVKRVIFLISNVAYAFNADSQDIDRWTKYFAKKNSNFVSYIANAYKYKEVVVAILESYDLPTDLFYVGLIESGYNPRIKSHKGAVGHWQFMRKTAIHYGLIVNNLVDERMNIIKSTHAAAKYFKDLHNIFNSWELALVAYNSGEYRIINLIRKHGSRKYEDLLEFFPKETANYIPKVMAAKKVMENLTKYNINIELPEEYYKNYNDIQIREIDFLKLADRYRMEIKKLKEMNPDILVDNMKLNYDLTVLVEGDPTNYQVRSGETLTDIAKRFNVDAKDLIWINRLTSTKLYPGQTLRIAFKDN